MEDLQRLINNLRILHLAADVLYEGLPILPRRLRRAHRDTRPVSAAASLRHADIDEVLSGFAGLQGCSDFPGSVGQSRRRELVMAEAERGCGDAQHGLRT